MIEETFTEVCVKLYPGLLPRPRPRPTQPKELNGRASRVTDARRIVPRHSAFCKEPPIQSDDDFRRLNNPCEARNKFKGRDG